MLGATGVAAQENMISAPPPLQWPGIETGENGIAMGVIRGQIEDGAVAGLCQVLLERAGRDLPANLTAATCPADIRQMINAGEGDVRWAGGAKPRQCADCVGRPFVTQTAFLNRPNTAYTSILGRLAFVGGPSGASRDVTIFYDAQFHCALAAGSHRGVLVTRFVPDRPVVGGAGTLEGIADFFTVGRLSDWLDAKIAASLRTPAAIVDSGDACTTIGALRNEDRAFDAVTYHRPGRAVNIRGEVAGAAVHPTATVRFLRLTRKATDQRYTPPAEAGAFVVYLNGEAVVFPDLPELQLPAAGGSTPLNLCRTIDMSGADRLQVVLANSHGGGVWSQFGAHQRFGEGRARKMTTGRTVVVGALEVPDAGPQPPGGSKPQAIVLREFELLYSIDYTAEPTMVATETTSGEGGRRVTEAGSRAAERAAERFGDVQRCREI
jgi:hypothetical protein